jgi:predicted DNA binding CopG/RHH family protein
MKKSLQLFSDESLERSKNLTPTEIAQFLEDFRNLHSLENASKSILISLKVPENLLRAFRQKAEIEGVLYQTMIKRLMTGWLGKS